MGPRHMTIGDLALAAETPKSTIRYYERAGLLRPSARSASNYRLYSADDLERLRFIRAAQASGFTLKDVAHLLRPAPCRRVQQMIRERLDQVEARMREFRRVSTLLRRSLDECKRHERTGRCGVVDELTARARRR